jgi:hypothetical protein
MTRPSGVAIFFISAADGDVYRTDLSESADIKVAHWASTNHWHDHLELRERPADSNYWDLAAVRERREAMVV